MTIRLAAVLLILFGLAGLHVGAAQTPPALDERMAAVETRVAVHDAILGLATPTITPLPPTATAVPSATPTVVPSPASSPVPPPSTPAVAAGWHPPTTHEHGDAPPPWATDFSVAHFGHPVVYGGDERSSDTENVMKHQAYKGLTATTVAGGDVYFRYHAASNPHDRSARYHSYEVYYRDTSGNVSFWQGWYDTGNPNSSSARCLRRIPALACEGNRPIILVTDETSFQHGPMFEQWYMFANGAWSWDMGVAIGNSTTFYRSNENATAMDQNTWVPTGSLGLTRRSDGFWYLGRGGNPRGWFCATPLGMITSMGSQTCAVGSLPQYIATTIAADARADGFGNMRVEWLIQKPYACPLCVLPN